MPSVNLCPTFGVGYQAFDANGKPLNAGLLYAYSAGTSAPLATYTSSAGTVANTNPIVLGADGRPPQEVWLIAGSSYKLVLADNLLNILATYDNVSGINDVASQTTEWYPSGLTPTFIGATQFSFAGDQTAIFTVGRRVKCNVTAGLSYGTITASAYVAVTTITVDTTGSNAIDSGISAVSYGILSSSNASFPLALQTAQEAGTSRGVIVTPALQQYHPSACKGWCEATVLGTFTAGYNVASVTDGGTGDASINWTVPFSAATSFTAVATARSDATSTHITSVANTTTDASRVRVLVRDTGGAPQDPDQYCVAAFGDQ